MSAALYCIRADLAEEIQVTDPNEDTRLDRAITDASRAIDAFCRQPQGVFAPQTAVRYFDVRGSQLSTVASTRTFAATPMTDNSKGWYDQLWLPYPLLSVTELATDDKGDGSYSTIWTENTDFYLLPYNTEVKRKITTNADIGRYGFPSGQKRVRITGSWGITEDGLTPYPIRRACLQLATIYYRKPTTPSTSSGLGGAAVHIGYTDPDIAAILWEVAGKYRETLVFA
jgi:hypothetical protein